MKDLSCNKDDEERLTSAFYSTCLFDDKYMNIFMQGQNDCAKALISPIIEKDDLIIKQVQTQKDLRSVGGKAIKLDILATDKDGRLYNIEVQRASSLAKPKRARLNISLIDSEFIKESDNFEDLPVVYIIFFTESDIYKEGRATYKIEPCLIDDNKIVNMDVHIIYVNGQYKGDDAVGKLICDMWQSDPSKIQNKTLCERAKFIKPKEIKGGSSMENEFLKQYQEAWYNEGKGDGREEGMQENSLLIARAMLQNNLSVEMVLKCTGISAQELQSLQSESCA